MACERTCNREHSNALPVRAAYGWRGVHHVAISNAILQDWAILLGQQPLGFLLEATVIVNVVEAQPRTASANQAGLRTSLNRGRVQRLANVLDSAEQHRSSECERLSSNWRAHLSAQRLLQI